MPYARGSPKSRETGIVCPIGLVVRVTCAALLTLSAGAALPQLKIATVSPKADGFLRELAGQPSLKVRYRFYESVH